MGSLHILPSNRYQDENKFLKHPPLTNPVADTMLVEILFKVGQMYY